MPQTDYYQSIITDKSWKLLQQVRKQTDCILIGGWAVWLHARALKSKDIDIIVDYDVLAALKEQFSITKNERLKKYEAKVQEIDIDIYVPHYSHPGLPPEIIQQYTHVREGFTIPTAETLLILKQFVYNQRKGSIKGQKDKLDIVSLIQESVRFPVYKALCARVGYTTFPRDLRQLLAQTYAAPELGLDRHRMARLKKRILSQLTSLQ